MVIAASQLQIIDSVGLLDSSRDLQSIHVKKFINKLHLVLYACVEKFDMMFFFCIYRVYGWGPQFRSVAFLGPTPPGMPPRACLPASRCLLCSAPSFLNSVSFVAVAGGELCSETRTVRVLLCVGGCRPGVPLLV